VDLDPGFYVGWPSISANGLTLVFADDTSGEYGSFDILVTTRATTDAPWAEPENLGATVNSSSWDCEPALSHDGLTLYFTSNRPGGRGGWDTWQAPVIPIVDFNGDGFVDVKDVVIMTEHWGENYSLCDIGPTPFGDGIVDIHDLVVLTEYIEPIDRTLVAHWALDETEGITAHDSVNGYDDYVMGGALWQPAGGMIGGALELDGVDDCIITSFGPNPADGPFSVFAWIKGGAPERVIISQPAGTDWLALDAEGKLMTKLKSSDQLAGSLLSGTVITDGQWHRIGLVWDGSHRTLCVDGVAVAEDTQSGLEASVGGLYIGVGKNYAAGTFFSGLIDDVRIYNRAVRP
jgi:hypothetical protein